MEKLFRAEEFSSGYALGFVKQDFDSLSPANKRRAIARDVRARLKNGQIKAFNGQYIHSTWKEVVREGRLLSDYSKCECCVLGACVMSLAWAGRKDGPLGLGGGELDDTRPREGVIKFLSKYFPEKQMDMMECVFENSVFQEMELTPDDIGRCRKFSQKLIHLHQRERASILLDTIMANIVEHGEFNP